MQLQGFGGRMMKLDDFGNSASGQVMRFTNNALWL